MWTLRLGTFLYIRIKKAGEDKRFREIKKSFSWFLMAFTVSGMQVSICAICALTGISNGIELTSVTYIGIVIFIIGFVVEIISDNQKTNFRKIEDNKDKFIKTGLWKYSRHPNYTCEQLIWITFYLFSVSASGKFINWSIIGCLLLVILFYFSAKFSEGISSNKYPDYKNYQKNTPMFIGY